MVGGRGWGDRQPVPRAKLFCLRFCGRIEFVARFTLILDKHFFSVLDWRREGGGGGGAKWPGKGDHTPSAGRPTFVREELLRPRRPPQEYRMYVGG